MNLILFLLVILVSSFLQGVTGFGFAVLAAPLGLLIFDQQTLVVALTVVSLVLNFYLLNKIKAKTDKKIVSILLVSGLIGVPFGVVALLSLPAVYLKIAAGGIAILFAGLFFFPKIKIKNNRMLTEAVGLLTGFLQASIGLSGPPVALLLTGYQLEPVVARKSLAIFFLGLSTMTLPLFFLKKVLTGERLLIGLAMIPAIFIGGHWGDKVSGRINRRVFRLITLILVLVSGIQVILNAR